MNEDFLKKFELNNCTIEQLIGTQYVDKIECETMMVQQQIVSSKFQDYSTCVSCSGKAGSKSQGQSQSRFDIEAIPAEYFDFFRWVNLKEARREVIEMRSALAREVERYEDISHRKTPLMLSVIEPLILKDRLKHVPTHSVLEALFGDVIDGYSRQAHTKFREEVGRKHLHFRPKRKS